jgi:sugar/nucleoside kinase (ribokinase family)
VNQDSSERRGLLAAGNFIIDHVKIIDAYPAPEMLCNISAKTSSNGGGPYNVLKDLAKLGAPFPLSALGLIGEDVDGAWILEDCARHGIDTTQLQPWPNTDTSYTDAMTVEATGQRTFFHHRGANAVLGPEHVDFSQVTAKWFYLGYILLLDNLDALDVDGCTGASIVLERAKAAGLTTVVDFVSVPDPDVQAIASSALPFIDVLFVNEIEAGLVLGRELRGDNEEDLVDWQVLESACRGLVALGVGQRVILHCRHGAIAVSASGEVVRQTSVNVPDEAIVGSTGAGDAFAAGVLYGMHEDWPIGRSLKLGVCAAAISLGAGSPSDGMLPVEQCLEKCEAWGAD